MNIHLVYIYERPDDSMRDLCAVYLDLDDAKRFVETLARERFEFLQREGDADDDDSAYVAEWYETDSYIKGQQLEYHFTQECHITRADEWIHTLGRYAIESVPVGELL